MIVSAVRLSWEASHFLKMPPTRIVLRIAFILFSVLAFRAALLSLAQDKALLLERCSIAANMVPQTLYWNDFQDVRNYLNRLATGSEAKEWQEHLRPFSCCGHFKKVLVFYCQAGSLEAELYSKGLIKSAVGVDGDLNKIIEARQRAKEYNLPFEYFHLTKDSEEETVPDYRYDLIINNDLGFVKDLDFHLRVIYKLLKRDDGIFVTNARVRPQAASFLDSQWRLIQQINDKTEIAFKHESLTREESVELNNLIIPTLNKYFEPIWNRSLNGALAYSLLSRNPKLGHELYEREIDLRQYVTWIIREDERYAIEHPGSQSFWFGILKAKDGLTLL